MEIWERAVYNIGNYKQKSLIHMLNTGPDFCTAQFWALKLSKTINMIDICA